MLAALCTSSCLGLAPSAGLVPERPQLPDVRSNRTAFINLAAAQDPCQIDPAVCAGAPQDVKNAAAQRYDAPIFTSSLRFASVMLNLHSVAHMMKQTDLIIVFPGYAEDERMEAAIAYAERLSAGTLFVAGPPESDKDSALEWTLPKIQAKRTALGFGKGTPPYGIVVESEAADTKKQAEQVASAPACECGYELLGRRSEAVALAVPAAGWEEAMLGFVMNGTAAEDDLSPTFVTESSLPADVAAAAARVPLPGLETRTELGSLGTIRANATSSGWLLIFDGVYFELPLLGLYAAPSELLAGASSTRVPARPEPVARPLPSPWAGRLWWETALQLLACSCAGLTAVIAVFYTTECGGSRYLHAWSDAFLSAHGVGAQQQAVLDSWFFAPNAEDRPLLPRDRTSLM